MLIERIDGFIGETDGGQMWSPRRAAVGVVIILALAGRAGRLGLNRLGRSHILKRATIVAGGVAD